MDYLSSCFTRSFESYGLINSFFFWDVGVRRPPTLELCGLMSLLCKSCSGI